MFERVQLIGGFTRDFESHRTERGRSEEEEIGGGAVAYSGVALQGLGWKVGIISRCDPDFKFLDEVKAAGVKIHCLAPDDSKGQSEIITFHNEYDQEGERHQTVSNAQDTITTKDWSLIRPLLEEGQLIFVAPVIGEVDPALFEKFSQIGRLIVTPQGYFRHPDSFGNVSRGRWEGVDKIRHARIAVLSQEDLRFGEHMDEAALEEITQYCPTVVLTLGKDGLTIFHHGEEPINIQPFDLKRDEIKSPTGAGDSCAAAFVWYYYHLLENGEDELSGEELREAGAFAGLYPALKLMGIGAGDKGVAALLDKEQVRQYIQKDPDNKVADYLLRNHLSGFSLIQNAS